MTANLIFDLGANRGDDTEYYLRKGFSVVAVEANPQLVATLEKRFARWVDDKQLTIVNIGIAAQRGEMPFYIQQNDEWSSFVPKFGVERGVHTDTIPVRTAPLADLLDEFGTPHYLKIDIEGHDDAAVASLEQSAHRPRYVSVEATVENFWQRMHDIGYRGFKYINQRWHQSLPPVNPPREGLFCDTQTGSSGPFGEETYGPWLTLDEFKRERDILFNAAFRKAPGDVERIVESGQHSICGVPIDLMLPPWYDWHCKLED